MRGSFLFRGNLYHLIGKSPANRLKMPLKQMQHLETQLEKQCRTYARLKGCVCWKNEKNGNKGIPDDSFLTPDGRFFMVEFKKDAKAYIRPEQITWKNKFPTIVNFVSSFEDFKELLQKYVE